MEVATGNAATIGPITVAPYMIGIAVDGAGNPWGYVRKVGAWSLSAPITIAVVWEPG